ncbi:hypothetical protein AB0F72_08450 [Actinoplanes sp. NPDC023936]|uniref:hypothetical protein n=1 Tax=Actinoplanes sp. NPDC023936 TaxID=3154910 RepID=UPI0033D8B0CB
MTTTVRTILDAPLLPLFGEDEIRWQQCQARLNALLAKPCVTDVLDQLHNLTDQQAGRIESLWLANFRLYRTEQLQISHRLGKTDRQRHVDVLTVKEHVWRVADKLHGDRWSVSCAAQDVVFAGLYADLLGDDEARLFTKPWIDTLAR